MKDYQTHNKTKDRLFLAAILVLAAAGIWVTTKTPVNVSEDYVPGCYSTIWSLLPPVIAITLALITKEVYSSLFVGIAVGALLYSNGNLVLAMNTMLYKEDAGLIMNVCDSSNVSILTFVILLGTMVALMNRSGGSKAFGRWATAHIHSRAGAQLATMLLGILIFIDDGFNCMTVGSVMRPVTDEFKVSRSKLAYIIDSTAAPVCIIAPISCWAAAVSYSVPEDSGINGFQMFIQTIPYNYYALGTLLMLVLTILLGLDFGPMAKHEENALNGDLFSVGSRVVVMDADANNNEVPVRRSENNEVPVRRSENNEAPVRHSKIISDASVKEAQKQQAQMTETEEEAKEGKISYMVIPVIVLLGCCIIGILYTGGLFDGASVLDAFANAESAKGLVFGSLAALLFTFCFYLYNRVMDLNEFLSCLPEGWRSMCAPMIILIMAWNLSGMTGLLGASDFIHNLVEASAGSLSMFLPCIIFLIAIFLAFSTGTSWGTFSILIPIVCSVFPDSYEMLVVSIAACLSGAVCGDHCSPISDTTIMSSAGAQCDHVNHVSTQLPYAMTVAAASAVGYLTAGVVGYLTGNASALVGLPVTCLVLVGMVMVRKRAA